MMEKMSSTVCPYCQGPLVPVEYACDACSVSLKGRLGGASPLQVLSPEEQGFLVEFLLSGASIKETETRIGMSYPAVRARLDRVIGRLRRTVLREKGTAEVLDAIEEGKLTVEEAIKRIKGA